MNLSHGQRRLAILLGPSIVVLSLFLLIFQVPLIKQRKQLDIRYHKLAAKVSRLDFQSQADKLRLLQREADNLNGLACDGQGSSKMLVSTPQGTSDAKGLAAPAATLAGLLDLLESHQLRCTATSPLIGLAGRPQTNSPSSAASQAAVPKKETPLRVRIQAQGSFQSMRAALLALKSNSTALRVQQLEMAEVDAMQDRAWILTVLLKERQP